MKRFLQLVACLILLSTTTFAGRGGFGERLFFQLGGTIGADVMNMTGSFVLNDRSFDYSNLHVNYATVVGAARVNFLEFSNNASLALTTRPCFSFGRSFNDVGGGNATSIRLPFTIDFNSGAAATVSTRAKTGFSFGLGAEYVMFPIASGKGVSVYDISDGKGSTNSNSGLIPVGANWLQPIAVVGIKFFGKHYYCREINFKASFSSLSSASNKAYETGNEQYRDIKDWQTVGLMISFLQYLNY